LDPYRIRHLSEGERQIERICFARNPESDIWVEFAGICTSIFFAPNQTLINGALRVKIG
jgi:hypothetical protein